MSVDPEQGTPDTGNSPDPAVPDSPQVDWEKRYTDTQAAYTQSQQELARLKKLEEDEEAFRRLGAEKFGYQFDGDDDDGDVEVAVEGTDPRFEQLSKQQQELLAWQQQVEADRAQERFERDLNAEADGRDIPEQGRDWILSKTLAGGNDRDALAKATKAWFEFEDSLRGPSKRPRVPHVPSGGGPAGGGKPVEEMSRAELNRYVLDRVNADAA